MSADTRDESVKRKQLSEVISGAQREASNVFRLLVQLGAALQAIAWLLAYETAKLSADLRFPFLGIEVLLSGLALLLMRPGLSVGKLSLAVAIVVCVNALLFFFLLPAPK